MMQDNCNCNGQNNWNRQGMNQGCSKAGRMEQRGGCNREAGYGQNGDRNPNPCYHKELPVDRMKLGMGYVPWSTFENVMCAKDGMEHGTIFADLVLPFTGTGSYETMGNGRRCR